MIKICPTCKNEFNTNDKRQKYCCKDCFNKAPKKSSKILVHCDNCGKDLLKYPSQILQKNFCSRECSKNYLQKNNINCKCDVCGKDISVPKNQYDNSTHHYCSKECKYKGNSLFYSGTNSPNYSEATYTSVPCTYCGKPTKVMASQLNRSERHFCSKDCQNKWQSENVRGINHPNYNPDISLFDRTINRNYTEYWDWRKNVYLRDNFTCQCCGDNKGHNLVAHHILNYSEYKELRTDINNGITLCADCHKAFHKKYGVKHNNINQLDTFINERNRKAS